MASNIWVMSARWWAGFQRKMPFNKRIKSDWQIRRTLLPAGYAERWRENSNIRSNAIMTDVDFGASDKITRNQPASFYPNFITPEKGHPTSAQFVVVNSGDERGRGLQTKVAFRQGERVVQLSGIIVNHATLDTIQISPTRFLSDPWFCRFLLHSCDPNLAIDITTMQARAIRDICPNDYLTIDYAVTEDFLTFQFPCNCGASKCRGWIMGKQEKPNEQGRRFLTRKNR